MIRTMLICLVFGVLVFDVSADTEIRVLVVMAPGAVNDANIQHQLNSIEAVWDGSNIVTIATMSVANQKDASGNYIKPVLTSPALTTTSFLTTYGALVSGAYNLSALRDQFMADLVLVYLPSAAIQNACGYAPNPYWTDYGGTPGAYVANPLQLGADLRGAETAYLALLSTSPICLQIVAGNNTRESAAHEIGHLFGAGHDTSV